jgi:hypothetical protein
VYTCIYVFIDSCLFLQVCSFGLKTIGGIENIIRASQKIKTFDLELFDLKAKNLAELDTDLLGREAGSDPYVVVNTDPPCILEEQVSEEYMLHACLSGSVCLLNREDIL